MFRRITAAVALAATFGTVGLVSAAAATTRGSSRSQQLPVASAGTPRATTATTPPATTPPTGSPASTASPSSSPLPYAVETPAPVVRPGSKVIYLTFDDGPDPVWTPQILQVLTENHATATFFDIGENVVGHIDLVQAIRAQGSQVANHTWDHASVTGLTDAEITAELDRTDAVQGKARCVRPPYGATDPRVDALIEARGQRVELWDVDTRDWTRPGVAAIERELLAARDRATVLMHTGGGDRSETVAAIRAALPTLRAEGYVLQGIPGC